MTVEQLQTEGKAAEAEGCTIPIYDLDADSNGYVRRGTTDEILIRIGMSPEQLVQTIAHEAYHLHQNLTDAEHFDRDRWEAEAERYAEDASARWWRFLQAGASLG